MCTSIVVNKKKTIVGWNLDVQGMHYRIRTAPEGVFIEIPDETYGFLPLFGANARGDFVGMPTCWPYDKRSDPAGEGADLLRLDIDLLLQKKTLEEIRVIAEHGPVYSLRGSTFMGALSDRNGNVLHIVPGQGSLYCERPTYKVLTNFSPFKGAAEKHPLMGLDRYEKAEAMLRNAPDGFDVKDCFYVLRTVSQTECPTAVSMVFDAGAGEVSWCENRAWENVSTYTLPN